MAIGLQSNFVINQETVQSGFVETLQQETEAFNSAANGAIVMAQNITEGDYVKSSFYEAIPGLVTRRDLTSMSALTDNPLTMDEFISVKINRKWHAAQTMNSFRKITEDPGSFSFILGTQSAKAVAIDQLNSGLRAAVAALTGVSALVLNVTAASPTDVISTDNLIRALALAGDSANDIALWVMHSAAYYKLVREQIVTHSFDSVAGVNIATGTPVTLGRPVLMTDSPALHANASPTDPVKVLGLRTGGVRLENSEVSDVVAQDMTGFEQLFTRIQGELAYNVGIKGFKWDITSGGANPTDTALGTSSNWDVASSSNKLLAGVMLIADPA